MTDLSAAVDRLTQMLVSRERTIEHLESLIGSMSSERKTFSEEEAINIIEDAQGNKIPKIKAFRTLTNAGLKEAKEAIERNFPEKDTK